MPSSSLVEVEAEVEVGLRFGGWGFRSRVRSTFQKLDLQSYFFGRSGGVVGWVVGDLRSKANLNLSCS